MSNITYEQLAQEASSQIEAGNHDGGLALYEQAITLARSEGEIAIAAALLNNLALAQDNLGQGKAARESLLRAVDLLVETEFRVEYAQALDNLGYIERDLGNLNVALKYHQMAQVEFNALGEWENSVHALTNLAIIYKDQGRLTEAKASFEHALALLADHVSPRIKGHAWLGLGLTWERLNNIEKARNCYREALVAYHDAEGLENEALTLHNLGKLHDQLEEFDAALAYYRRSLQINQEIKAKLGMAEDLGALASVYQATGDLDQARKLHEEALQIQTDIGYRRGQVWTLIDLAILDRNDGRFDQATDQLSEALTLAQEIADPYEEYELYLNRGDVNLMVDRVSAAVEDYSAAVGCVDTIRSRILLEDEAVSHFDKPQLEAYDRLVYITATRLSDTKQAFYWAEQARAREFLRRLRLSEIMQSTKTPVQLQNKEKQFLVHLRQAAADLSVSDSPNRLRAIKNYQALEAQLHNVWTEIKLFAPEYVALRRGDVVDFLTLQECLH